MEVFGNIMIFDSDEEFSSFCIEPYGQIIRDEKIGISYSGVYSEEYKKCIAEGRKFTIKDDDSKVLKRNCVCERVPIKGTGFRPDPVRLVQMNVENLVSIPNEIFLIEKSDTYGHAAMRLFRLLYFGNEYIDKNIELALQYLKKAIELGDANAIQFQKEHKLNI